jgi:hypothetical protein
VALVLALATPEPVLVVGAGELTAGVVHLARRAHGLRGRLTALPRLGTLGRRREEQLRQTFARCRTHPPIIGELAMEQNFDRGHGTPSFAAR